MKRQDEGKGGWCEEAMPNIAQQCGLTELALCKHCFLSGVGAYCAAAEEGDAGPPRPWRGDGDQLIYPAPTATAVQLPLLMNLP